MCAASKYSRSASFGPVRFSYQELFVLVQRVRNLVQSANGSPTAQRVDGSWESLRLSDDTVEILINDNFTAETLRGAPEVSREIWYDFRFHGDDVPISEVELKFSDFSRKLKVTGTSREQVDAIITLVTDDSRKRKALLGGATQRIVAGTVLQLIGIIVFILGLNLSMLPLAARFTVSLFGVAIYFGAWFFPWTNWLPGVAVYSGDASFVVRRAPEISFAGVILTLITFALGVALTIYLAP